MASRPELTLAGATAVAKQNSDQVGSVVRTSPYSFEIRNGSNDVIGEAVINPHGVLALASRVPSHGDYLTMRYVPYYDVVVFEEDNIVYWADRSAVTYYCSANKLLFVEPLYQMSHEDDEHENYLPDPDYWAQGDVLGKEHVELDVRELLTLDIEVGDTDWLEMTDQDCHDLIREELNANCVI